MIGQDIASPVDLRCSVVIINRTEVLLLHRRIAGRDDWVLPGGSPRPGESTGACARREVAEETGLDVNPARCAFVLEVTNPTGEQRIIELVFLGELLSTAKHLKGEDHSEPTWVPIGELAGLNLRPPIAGYIAPLALGTKGTAPYLGNMWRPEDT